MGIRRSLSVSAGMNPLSKDRRGLSLLEVLIAVLLMSVIFMGVSSLYLAGRKFYIASSDKVIIGYEAQYAIQHIYKYVMRGIGDENAPPFQITGSTQLDISINDSDPLTSANYTSGVENYRYRYNAIAKKIYFRAGSGTEEDLVPKVSVSDVNFTKSGNALTGYITAGYGSQSLTFYFACYPRLASFN